MRERTARLIEAFASISPPSEFSCSPDGLTIAFTQRVSNYSQIFALPVEQAGWPRRITASLADCSEPHWAPDGQALVFVRGKGLWIANADGTNAHALTDHPAGNTSPRWSPDKSRIAFLSRRRGWNHLWTMAPSGDELSQLTHGAFDAVDPVWSPDSRWLAFCSVHEDDLMTRAVYLIPASGGEGHSISPRGCWSGAPSFSPDGTTLAYLSDQDRWFHIYLYDLSSRSSRSLTHGEFEDGGPHFYEIEPEGGPVFSPDGKQIAFIRHREGKFDVWVVDVATGRAQRLSRNDGHYSIVGWLPGSTQIAVTFDHPRAPSDLWLLTTDGRATQLADSSVAEIKSHAGNLPKWVSYSARDGLTIPAALFRPERKGPAPAVLFLHGGPNFGFGEFYYPLPQILVQEGYVVLAPNYRGSTGYGTAFRQANFREWGSADAFDAIDGARWLEAQEFVDPRRIAVVGPSYGGYLTLCVLTLAPELFCAGVDLYGDSDIAEAFRYEDRDARLDLKRHMGAPEENPEGYRRGSPRYWAERIQAPVLILHGREDMLVVPRMSERMIEALKIENRYFEAHFYEDEEHGFEEPENKKDAWERVVAFLNRFCGGEED